MASHRNLRIGPIMGLRELWGSWVFTQLLLLVELHGCGSVAAGRRSPRWHSYPQSLTVT